MKKIGLLALMGIFCTTLFTGCLNLELGGGTTNKHENATVGQELVDLQKAKDAGAINDAEYQAQKAKILNQK